MWNLPSYRKEHLYISLFSLVTATQAYVLAICPQASSINYLFLARYSQNGYTCKYHFAFHFTTLYVGKEERCKILVRIDANWSLGGSLNFALLTHWGVNNSMLRLSHKLQDIEQNKSKLRPLQNYCMQNYNNKKEDF